MTLFRFIALRAARETDVASLVEVARRSWLGAFAETAPAALVRYWRERDRESWWYPKYWPSMTVAELERRVVGVVQPDGNEINGLWVVPDAQRCGIGTTLLRHGEAAIARDGHRCAWLSCSSFNAQAQRFYLSRGYREARRELKVLECDVADEMRIYERDLSAEPGA